MSSGRVLRKPLLLNKRILTRPLKFAGDLGELEKLSDRELAPGKKVASQIFGEKIKVIILYCLDELFDPLPRCAQLMSALGSYLIQLCLGCRVCLDVNHRFPLSPRTARRCCSSRSRGSRLSLANVSERHRRRGWVLRFHGLLKNSSALRLTTYSEKPPSMASPSSGNSLRTLSKISCASDFPARNDLYAHLLHDPRFQKV